MESVAPAFLGWTDACGGVVGEDPDLCLGEGLGEGGSLEWARWTQLSVGPSPNSLLGEGLPPCTIILQLGCTPGEVGPSKNKGKAVSAPGPTPPTTLPAWSLSLPSLVGHGPGLYLPGSQLLKRKLPWAPRPLNANSSFRNHAGLT